MSFTKLLWLCTILLPATLLLAGTMCIWPGPRVLGVVSMGFLSAEPFLFLGMVATILALPCFLVLGFIHRQQAGQSLQGVSRASACLSLVVLGLAAQFYANVWRDNAFVKASKVGDQIVEALARYHLDKGAYPEKLDELIPDYLAEVPYTGMIGYPDFSYRRDFYDIEPTPGEYELRINCPSGLINFDRFIYWPSEVYPDRIQGNGVESFGRWAYVHE